MHAPIYLDYNATTPIAPVVAAAIRPYLDEHFGNPSSGHAYGRPAHVAVDRARAQVAALLGCGPDDVVFTGAGSEANNLAIKGVAFALRDRGDHIITSAVEHPAVLTTCRYLAHRFGYRVTVLPVDQHGRVHPDAVERAIEPRTILVTIMHANNETGTLQPIREIAAIARRRGVVVHTDAAQSVGKVPVGVDELGVDLLTVVGHKLYAPKGIGALYVRPGTPLDSLVHGAGHEGGRRAGTENVPYIAGLGAAAALAEQRLARGDAERVRTLRDRLHATLAAAVPGLRLNGHPTDRLPNTLNVSFPGVDGEELLARAPEVAASTGSACHAGRTEPSTVLLAMGLDRERALGAVRLSLGYATTEADVDAAAAALARAAVGVTASAAR
ncbi:MAG: cysteine desulfurase [Chloroflexota bacterium]|nr:cysteine desulfurase [Chloroflexota bacterium]